MQATAENYGELEVRVIKLRRANVHAQATSKKQEKALSRQIETLHKLDSDIAALTKRESLLQKELRKGKGRTSKDQKHRLQLSGTGLEFRATRKELENQLKVLVSKTKEAEQTMKHRKGINDDLERVHNRATRGIFSKRTLLEELQAREAALMKQLEELRAQREELRMSHSINSFNSSRSFYAGDNNASSQPLMSPPKREPAVSKFTQKLSQELNTIRTVDVLDKLEQSTSSCPHNEFDAKAENLKNGSPSLSDEIESRTLLRPNEPSSTNNKGKSNFVIERSQHQEGVYDLTKAEMLHDSRRKTSCVTACVASEKSTPGSGGWLGSRVGKQGTFFHALAQESTDNIQSSLHDDMNTIQKNVSSNESSQESKNQGDRRKSTNPISRMLFSLRIRSDTENNCVKEQNPKQQVATPKEHKTEDNTDDENILDDDQQAAVESLKALLARNDPNLLNEIQHQSNEQKRGRNENNRKNTKGEGEAGSASTDYESSSDSETESLKEWRHKKREEEALADQNSIQSFDFGTDKAIPVADCTIPPQEIVLDEDQLAAMEKLKTIRMKRSAMPGIAVSAAHPALHTDSFSSTESIKFINAQSSSLLPMSKSPGTVVPSLKSSAEAAASLSHIPVHEHLEGCYDQSMLDIDTELLEIEASSSRGFLFIRPKTLPQSLEAIKQDESESDESGLRSCQEKGHSMEQIANLSYAVPSGCHQINCKTDSFSPPIQEVVVTEDDFKRSNCDQSVITMPENLRPSPNTLRFDVLGKSRNLSTKQFPSLKREESGGLGRSSVTESPRKSRGSEAKKGNQTSKSDVRKVETHERQFSMSTCESSKEEMYKFSRDDVYVQNLSKSCDDGEPHSSRSDRQKLSKDKRKSTKDINWKRDLHFPKESDLQKLQNRTDFVEKEYQSEPTCFKEGGHEKDRDKNSTRERKRGKDEKSRLDEARKNSKSGDDTLNDSSRNNDKDSYRHNTDSRPIKTREEDSEKIRSRCADGVQIPRSSRDLKKSKGSTEGISRKSRSSRDKSFNATKDNLHVSRESSDHSPHYDQSRLDKSLDEHDPEITSQNVDSPKITPLHHSKGRDFDDSYKSSDGRRRSRSHQIRSLDELDLHNSQDLTPRRPHASRKRPSKGRDLHDLHNSRESIGGRESRSLRAPNRDGTDLHKSTGSTKEIPREAPSRPSKSRQDYDEINSGENIENGPPSHTLYAKEKDNCDSVPPKPIGILEVNEPHSIRARTPDLTNDHGAERIHEPDHGDEKPLANVIGGGSSDPRLNVLEDRRPREEVRDQRYNEEREKSRRHKTSQKTHKSDEDDDYRERRLSRRASIGLLKDDMQKERKSSKKISSHNPDQGDDEWKERSSSRRISYSDAGKDLERRERKSSKSSKKYISDTADQVDEPKERKSAKKSKATPDKGDHSKEVKLSRKSRDSKSATNEEISQTERDTEEPRSNKKSAKKKADSSSKSSRDLKSPRSLDKSERKRKSRRDDSVKLKLKLGKSVSDAIVEE